jgi:large subunit ribosomal protein L13
MEKEEIIIDGKNATLGRLASHAAKESLLGKKIIILNSDEVVIIGNKSEIIKKYKIKTSRGGAGLKGPKMKRDSEGIRKRTVRGMLSHKEGRGRDAIRRVICYGGIPIEYANTKKIIFEEAKTGKFITLKELANMIK